MQLLHLVGGTNTWFYHDLSVTYHQSTVLPQGMVAHMLRVDPDGDLHLTRVGDAVEQRTDLAEISTLCHDIDLMVPFMFCPPGMTVWRDMFETVFKVPVVGPPLDATVISTSKWQTKALAIAENVHTPTAHRVRRASDLPDWRGPVIVKPDGEDNSIGLNLVTDEASLGQALEEAWSYTPTALIETYIPGREVRVGVLDLDGEPCVLPILEYHVSDAHPIRRSLDKVAVDADGRVTRKSWEQPALETSCPAQMEMSLQRKLSEMALELHKALGCRDYSLFDFRIHANTGAPYLLEACSFWTFAPISIVSRMLEAQGDDLTAVTARLFHQAAARDTRQRTVRPAARLAS